MPLHFAARTARRIALILVFSLLAASCGGGSDSESSTADSADDAAAAVDESSSGNDSSDDTGSDDAGSESASSVPAPTPPPPVDFDPAVERDCVHVAAVDAEATETEGEDVPLPPAEKPEVGEELLGSFDELTTIDLIEGTGTVASAGDTVGMQYVGVLGADGTEFDASWNRDAQPFVFTLGAGNVIAGWDEGIEGMKVGGRRVLQIPSAKAYGASAQGAVIGENADLIFIVDLIDVAAALGPDVPADTLGSFGELQIVDLVEGSGCEARVGDILVANYVGVNAIDGGTFDSSWDRGEPIRVTAGMSQVIDGWNEGLVGMKVGGERILQIPSAQAYNQGDLVFRVHLEEIIDAPLAHTLRFTGDTPDEVEITTLVEGSGDGAEVGDFLEANLVIFIYKSGQLVQSTWEQGSPTSLALVEESLLPGLNDGILGIKAGELRQVVLPLEIAYPDGVPQDAPFDGDDDAVVFVAEAISISGS